MKKNAHISFPATASRPYESGTEVHVDGPSWSTATSSGAVSARALFALDATDSMNHNKPGPVVRDHSAKVLVTLPTVERHSPGELFITAAEAREIAAVLMAAAGFARLCTRSTRPDVYSPFIVPATEEDGVS